MGFATQNYFCHKGTKSQSISLCSLFMLCVLSGLKKVKMGFTNTKIPYRATNSFSKLVLDYLDNDAALQPFYNFAPTIEGLKKAVEQRKFSPVNRQLLVDTDRKSVV